MDGDWVVEENGRYAGAFATKDEAERFASGASYESTAEYHDRMEAAAAAAA
jgi:hypothetical protein